MNTGIEQRDYLGRWKKGTISRNKSHEMSTTPIYHRWRAMKQRCQNPKNSGYFKYGARGITISKSWEKFENFFADMGNPPTAQHQIDRIDGNGSYNVKNCRWATIDDQARNRKHIRKITFNGKTMPLTDWAKELGISRPTLSNRLNGLGWSIEQAFSTKRVYGGGKKITRKFFGRKV